MALFHYSHNKALRLVLGIVLLIIVFPALFRIVFAAKDEVSYGASFGLSTCSDFFIDEESDLSRCITSYNITIGNTGTNHQELVRIDLTSVPKVRRLNWNVLDIVATSRTPIGPKISDQQQGETLHLQIQDLEPNRLVEFSISSQGIESAKQMENITISVQANGTTIEANPRMTVTLRFLRNLGGIFGV